MRRTALSSHASRLLTRAVATTALTALGVATLPAAAFAADGIVSVTATNGQNGVAAASNTALAHVSLSTTSAFVYTGAPTSVKPTITFIRTGTGDESAPGRDAIPATITSDPPTAPATTTQTFVVGVDLTSANPGTYDILVAGTVVGNPSTQSDRCSACFTVLASPPSVTSINRTNLAQGATATLVVTGTGFARGNYQGTNSNYACSACTNPPKLQLRAHGTTTPAAGVTFSDPLDSNNAPAPVAATSTTITKRLTLTNAVPTGSYDVYVENTDGQNHTLQSALTVDPAMTIAAISAQSNVPGAAAGSTLGQASSGGTVTVTGTNFTTTMTGSISFPGQTSDVSYTFVRDSTTQVRFTGVSFTAAAPTGNRTITLTSSDNAGIVSDATRFGVSAKPAPTGSSEPDSTVAGYGRGATGVTVKVTGTALVAGANAAGTQIVFSPATGITVTGQVATATDVTATVNVASNAPTGTVTLSLVNPDGGTAACSSACTFTINVAPSITSVVPSTEGRGQTKNVTIGGTHLAGAPKSAPIVTITNATHGVTSATSDTSVSVTAVHASATATGAQDITLVNGDDRGSTTCAGCFSITTLEVTGTTNGSALNDHTASGTVTGFGFDPAATVKLKKTGTGLGTVPDITGTVTTPPVESAPGAADGTSLTASFPLTGVDPGTYAYEVTNPGTSSHPGFGQGGLYTVVSNAPTITSLSHTSRGAGAANETILVNGTNFGPNAAVAFPNGSLAHIDSVTRNSSILITLVIHVDQDAPAASANLTVTNTDNQSATSAFNVVTGPHVKTVSPNNRGQGAADTTLTVKGTHDTFPAAANTELDFVGGSGVTASGFTVTQGSAGTVPALDVDATLTATLMVSPSATVGTYDVVLKDTTTGGRYVCVGCFTVHVKPTLTNVDPAAGAVGTTVNVTLTGTGFQGTPTVTATRGITVTVTSATPTTISASFAIPANATPDTFADVTVLNGDGGFSTLTDAFHLFGKPGAPTIGTAVPGNAKATVSWTAPASNGGSAITSYTVTASPGGATATAPASSTMADVTNLTNGTTYTFTVHATNAAGNGTESAASNSVTPRTVPGKPTGLSAVPLDSSATVSWTAPASTGGAAITGYTVTASPGGATASVDGATTTATVTGLTNGTAYTFTVHATNVAGDGAESDASSAVTPRRTPDAPTGVTASPGDGKAIVAWTAPASDGGSAITSYTVTASPGPGTATVNSPATTVEVTGLTNGSSYTFTVHATNVAGNSTESAASNAVTPRTVPGKPTAVSATAGDSSAVVSWTPPTSNGGSAVTSYTVTANPGGAMATVDGATTSATVTTLTNGTSYTFTVHASNPAGNGAESDPTSAVTPRTVPGAPTGVTASPGNGKATVSWTAPSSTGGAAITSYTVTASPGGATASVNAPATTVDVIGLTNGTAYTFTVHATNAAGDGADSASSSSVTPRTVPGKPTGVSASAGDGSAVVSWTAPASDGGSALTGYTVTASPGGASASVGGSTTSATVPGLTNGTAYTFTVHATNVAGDSAESDPSTPVTPAGNALSPSGVTASPGNGKATVSWTAPTDNGGSAIVSYTVTSSPGGVTATVSAPATTVDVTGLTNGTAYTFTVHATNGAGDSPESAPSNSVTPRTVPGAPTGVSATPGNGSASVSWTAPASNGGSGITTYTVTSSPGGHTATVNFPATSGTVSGLTNGTAYTFTVHATNAAGSSAESGGSAPVTPAAQPGAPTGVSATAGNGKATVSWTAPASTGGSAIVSYTVTSTPGGFTGTVSAPATSVDVTGLTNGTAYTFTVHATNGVGDGPESSASNSVTPRTVPGAPTGVTATPGNGSATVSWTAPASNGGSAITTYTVTPSPGGAPSTVNASATSATVSGLTNGSAYTFTVHATNVAGNSAESTASAPVTPAAVAGAPTGITATPGNGSAMVSWTAPADSGGSAIVSYTVTSTPGGFTKTVSTPATSATVIGLVNGAAYTFTVHATNGAGDGPESAASNAVTPRTLPDAPTGVSATPGDKSASVSWIAPANNGGATVTSYTVTSSPGGHTATVSGNPAGTAAPTTAIVTGLTNGTAYTFTVHATNVAGDSPESGASTAATPAVAPGAPTAVMAAAGDRQVTVSWTAPADNGGETVTSYTVTASPGGVNVTVTGSLAPTIATVIGLTNGTAYTFTVRAANAMGSGPASSPSAAVTPSTTPTAPQAVTATAGDATVHVTWQAPADNGGAAITGYNVALNGGTPITTAAGARSLDVHGLANGTSYTVTVKAQNVSGLSPAGSAAPVTPKYAVTLTLARSTSSVVYGGAVTLKGVLKRTSSGAPLVGRSVRLYGKTYPSTSYRLLATLTTSSTGAWSSVQKPGRFTGYFAQFTGGSVDQARTTSVIGVSVKFKITITSPAAGSTVRAGTVTVKASELPVTPGALGALLQKRRDGSIVTVAKATVDRYGHLVLKRSLARGTYSFAVQVSGSKGCTTNRTAFFTLKVV